MSGGRGLRGGVWTDDRLRDVHRGGVAEGEPRSLVSRPLVWAIRAYQQTVSRILGPVCGFYPSCSAYGVTALERHGPVRGSVLTGWRVLRCNPWSGGGVDHVPPRGVFRGTTGEHHHAASAPHTPAQHGTPPARARSTPYPAAEPGHQVRVPSSTPVSPAHHRD